MNWQLSPEEPPVAHCEIDLKTIIPLDQFGVGWHYTKIVTSCICSCASRGLPFGGDWHVIGFNWWNTDSWEKPWNWKKNHKSALYATVYRWKLASLWNILSLRSNITKRMSPSQSQRIPLGSSYEFWMNLLLWYSVSFLKSMYRFSGAPTIWQ